MGMEKISSLTGKKTQRNRNGGDENNKSAGEEAGKRKK